MNNYLLDRRTIFIFDNKDINKRKFIIGFLLYIIIFVLIIPYYLFKNSEYEILTAYLPNLDLIATVVGYNGGPFNLFLWKYLYNPVDNSIVGYISSNLINYFALLGVTYIIALYAYRFKDVEKAWSYAIIMLPLTYFIPSNVIIKLMNMFGDFINSNFDRLNNMHYFITLLFGLILTILIIFFEANIIYCFSDIITKVIKNIKLFINSL